jgi:hypothetical protein
VLSKLSFRNPARPMPRHVLDWQVALRRHTMEKRFGAPHAGVAPLLSVRRPGGSLGVTTHSIICGLLPAPEQLEEKTEELRRLYEESVERGARAVYDRGIEYLLGYYRDGADFDATSVTTLLPEDCAATLALRAHPSCSLVFYVFDLEDKSEVGRFRCLQLDCVAEVHRGGPVFDNVWWHNALFHGKTDHQVVIRFRHLRTLDTRFGGIEDVA